jgi:hypothetical protein
MSTPSRMIDRASMALLLVAAVAFALLGAVPMFDHTTHRVLLMVDPIPWSEVLRPFRNPEPMLAWALRPLSVVLLKLQADAFGPLTVPPLWLLRAKIGLSILALGLSARAFLRAWGFGVESSLAALTTVVLAPTLFSTVLLPELDAVGAAATLAGGALLARRGALGWRWLLAVPLVLFALLLKESSGLVQFAFLIAGTMVCVARGHRTRAVRHAVLIVVGAGVWAWLVSGPLQPGADAMVRGLSWRERLPIAEHNSAQLLSFLGLPGVALLLLGTWGGAGRRGALLGAGGALLVLALLPSLVWHDHFAAYYYAPRAVATGAGLVMWGALAVRLLRRDSPERLAALGVFGPVAAVTLALLVASSPREDLASRLFLASAPLLHALVWRAARGLWVAAGASRGARVAVAGLTLSFAWWPLVGGLNYLSEFRAAMAVDTPSRARLAQEPLLDGVVMFNHMVLWVDDMELQAAGAPAGLAQRTSFVHVPDWLTQRSFPEADWGEGRMLLEGLWRTGTPMWLVWSAAQPRDMVPDARARFEGDLSWTRRSVGIFTPLNYSPGDHAFDEMIRSVMPKHNRIEDARMTRFRSGPTPLQRLAAERGQSAWSDEHTFHRLPPALPRLPWRLLAGVPVVERWTFRTEVTRLSPPADR